MAKKRLDNEAPALVVVADFAQPTVEFDIWYAMRETAIPDHHRKEILKADFRARGLKENETIEAFDKALIKYGVRI